MNLKLKNFNVREANDALIKELFKNYPHCSMKEATDALGVSHVYLKAKLNSLKIKVSNIPTDANKEKYFARFDRAKWNRNIQFTKSSSDELFKYVKMWQKERNMPNLVFHIHGTTGQPTILYMQKP